MLYVSIEVNKMYADIAEADDVEAGIYMKMFYKTLSSGGVLNKNDYTLKRVLSSQDKKQAAEFLLNTFFYQDAEGNWRHALADELIGRAQDRSDKASKAAQARHSSNANAMLTQCSEKSQAVPSEVKLSEVKLSKYNTPPTPHDAGGDSANVDSKKSSKRVTASSMPCPEGVEAQTWADFLTVRKSKNAPVTETALAGIQREADKCYFSLQQAIAMCVERSWQGFKAEWVLKDRDAMAAKVADVSQAQRDKQRPAAYNPDADYKPLSTVSAHVPSIFRPEPSAVKPMPAIEGQLTEADCPSDYSAELWARFLSFRKKASLPTTAKTLEALHEREKASELDKYQHFSMRNTATIAAY